MDFIDRMRQLEEQRQREAEEQAKKSRVPEPWEIEEQKRHER